MRLELILPESQSGILNQLNYIHHLETGELCLPFAFYSFGPDDIGVDQFCLVQIHLSTPIRGAIVDMKSTYSFNYNHLLLKVKRK